MKKLSFSLIIVMALCFLVATHATAQIWQLGYSSMTFVDASRNNRAIPANLFYPADVAGVNVPLGSPIDKRYPVIVMGHDENTPYQNYQYMWDHWTDKGFVVVIPLTEMTVPMDVEAYALDMAFIAQQFKVMRNDPNSFFYQRHNNKSCLMGHGKGGSAAILAAANYPAVNTVITFAANESVPSAIAAASLVTSPSVVVAAGMDCVSPVGTTQEAIFNNIDSDCKAFINFTAASRCYFAQNAGICTINDNPCSPVSTQWQSTALDVTWYLVSFMRYYLKSNEPALNKFEWKLQQKDKDLSYVFTCLQNAPRIGWQPEDSDGESEFDVPYVKLGVYPNPVTSGNNFSITLESEYETRATVMITDMMGRIVYNEPTTLSENANQIELSTQNLSKGSYIVVVSVNNQRTTMPLVVR